MIYINKIDDIMKMKINIEKEYLTEIMNTFISYYESLGWDKHIKEFSLKQYGEIVVIESKSDVKKLKSILKENKFNVDMWILNSCIIYKFEICNHDKIYTLFLNRNSIKDYLFEDYIYQNLRYIKRSGGVKIQLC